MNTLNKTFLPVTLDECHARGWDAPDFVYVCGDAYVDHPSFGLAIISRILEKAGYRVAMLCLPPWQDASAFKQFGKPRLGFLVSAGVIDSMVNHYTVAKKRRHDDAYAPGGKGFMRPDRATIVYCNRIRQAYRDVPILIGGVEASLRRFSHYDYWDDKVRHSILVDSGATLLMYGMGETSIIECANWVRGRHESGGTAENARHLLHAARRPTRRAFSCQAIRRSAPTSASTLRRSSSSTTSRIPIRGKRMCQQQDTDRYLIQNQPCLPLSREALDAVYDLPYTRTYHPMYDRQRAASQRCRRWSSRLPPRAAASARAISAPSRSIRGASSTSRSPESHPRARRKLLTTAAEFQGLYSRCRRPDGEFPPARVSQIS